MMEDVKHMLMLAKVYKRSVQPDKELETLSNVKDVQLRSANQLMEEQNDYPWINSDHRQSKMGML